MSVNTTTNKIAYTGNGSTTIFPYDFKILEAGHLVVYLNGVAQASGVGYTVSGVLEASGGAVNFAVAPANGVSVVLQREVPLTQPVNTVDNATILSSVLDTALDRLTMQVQQAQADTDAAIRTPVTDPASLDMTLPDRATRANKYFYFDANGEPTVIDSQIVGYYYGALAADPSTRPDGSARVAGDVYFNTTTLTMRVFSGTAWQNAVPPANLTLTNYTEVAASAKTTFTVSGGYNTAAVLVYLNGVLLYPDEYTASNGTTVVLNSACAISDEFRCISYSSFSVADTLSRSSNLNDLPSVATALTNLGFSAFVQGLRASADAAAFRTALALQFGATAALATTAEAQAGSNNTKVVTPLRVAEAIAALTPAQNLVLLGTLTTTSGTTQTLSGLNLTGYAALLVGVDGVSHNGGGGASQNLRLGTATLICAGSKPANANVSGPVFVTLGSGVAASIVSEATDTPSLRFGASGLSTASTSLSFTWDSGAVFDLGAIRVWGIRA